ncbi:MAG: PilZ domain-containing protein [Acidobacteriales bacterium]|nr:PilZ domain-containing protein [Candidatus Koribacter versatilis]MBI3646824.1 PilZ domain-containing protein [Terriglobales bacterium]
MILQALLVSKDDLAAETLTQVLANFGVAVDRSSAADVAVARLEEEYFDQIIVDFDDPGTASLVLESNRRQVSPEQRKPAVTVALLRDASQIRAILGAGAHFILVKPLTYDQAQATLRAATALLKRERRQSFRIPVQAAVSIRTEEVPNLEGILLDLSSGGMDVLAAKPLPSAALARFSFELPDGNVQVEGDAEIAWSSANGQTGLRFLDMDVRMREQLNEWLAGHSQEALPEEPDPVSHCKLTDMSLGGCYVETESPFPQSSAVDLCLKAAGMEIHTEGLVRIMHPSHGMGIEFPARTEEQRKSVGDFIEFLTQQPGATPELEISPRALRASAEELNQEPEAGSENDDPLLELLRGGDALEQAQFLDDLHRQRNSADVSQ